MGADTQGMRSSPPNKILSDTCRIEGCERPRKNIGQGRRSSLCDMHERRKHKHGDVNYVSPPRLTGDTCYVEGCDRLRAVVREGQRARYCHAHRNRWKRYGDLFEDIPVGAASARTSLPEMRERIKRSAE